MPRFHHPDWVALQTRQVGLEGTGEIRLRELVKESLRMRSSRIIVGEIRAEECLDRLLALNAGLPGFQVNVRDQSVIVRVCRRIDLPITVGGVTETTVSATGSAAVVVEPA